jgi:formyl-CoA transferase
MLGQHTSAMLRDVLGMSDAQIEELMRTGVIGG